MNELGKCSAVNKTASPSSATIGEYKKGVKKRKVGGNKVCKCSQCLPHRLGECI